MNLQEDQFIDEQDKENQVDLLQLFYRALNNWYWICFSVFLCFSIAYLYVRYTTPIYKITARVLVNDDKKGGGLGSSDAMGGLGNLLGTKSTVDNEAEIFKTKYLMQQVVRDMNLNIIYYNEGSIMKIELYSSPFIVQEVKLEQSFKSTAVNVEILKNNTLSIKTDLLDTTIKYNQDFVLPGVGVLQIRRNYAVPVLYEKYGFEIMSVKARAASIMNNLSVAVNNKQITIIDLALNYPMPKKGEDILNRLIYNYVQSNLKDKNEVADSTIKFIKNRLTYIGEELQGLEGNIQTFKQSNNLADMSEQGKLLVSSTGQFVIDLAKVETQINVLNSLEGYLNDAKIQRVLPSSLLAEDLVFNGLIEKYNTLLLEKDRRLLSTTINNPVVINLDEQIANLRKDMLSNLISTRNSFIISRNKIRSQMANAEGQIKQVPKTERNYLNLARQQQIKQELYIFLMQKSEETAISKTSNIANSRTIDPPEADGIPISPKSKVIYILGILMGVILPFGVLYLMEMLNTKIQNKKDITGFTSVPILGEIIHNAEKDNLVVANSSRSVIAEQFRALRTNLSFYLNGTDGNVIMMTSSMGGEGKSFVSLNLGNILALSGKRVALMELDLRKPGLSLKLDILNDSGFTNYIIDPTLKADDIIKPLSISPNMFIVNSGPIPPNPAELLMDGRMTELIAELKTKFDYIIIDAPPLGLVTDPQLIEPHASICLYVVRQSYTYKHQLSIVDDLYKDKKMKKIGIVINDINVTSGYGYGYGYGYGNYAAPSKDKTFLQKIFKRN